MYDPSSWTRCHCLTHKVNREVLGLGCLSLPGSDPLDVLKLLGKLIFGFYGVICPSNRYLSPGFLKEKYSYENGIKMQEFGRLAYKLYRSTPLVINGPNYVVFSDNIINVCSIDLHKK